MNPHFETYRQHITNPFRFKVFLLTHLPVAYFAGIKIFRLSPDSASLTVRYNWFNRNPFRSMYMGTMTFAAEMSTGVLSMSAVYKRVPAVSMLVVKNEGSYSKKAIGKITFTCNDGELVQQTVEKAISSGESTTVDLTSVAVNEAGEEVGRFLFTWSFKVRSRK